MTLEEENKFLKNWIFAMDRIFGDPHFNINIRSTVNSVSISLTGKFVAIESSGTVSVEHVEKDGE